MPISMVANFTPDELAPSNRCNSHMIHGMAFGPDTSSTKMLAKFLLSFVVTSMGGFLSV